ncbi:LrgB family protein [Solibacillus isronensis]|nr:LrgB family protein [Solibacillus isronensis]
MKVGHPLLLPILTATCITVIILLVFNIPYETYMEGGQWISKMLGPAVVALAFPLYNQRELIFKYKYSIITSIIVAMLAGLISVVALLLLFGSSKDFILTSLPKSLTTPVAMQVSDIVGGIPPLTAVMVMVAGFTGAILGPVLFKLFKIDTAISRGVAMGSASHGVGLTKLKEYSEEDLSIGSLSMGLSAVVGAFIIPLISIYLF